MPARIKSGASTWSLVSKISVKTASNVWSAVQRGYIKVASGWQLFFSGANPPVIVTGPSIRLTSYSGPLAGFFEFLREDLYGKDGTYTNYISISGRKFSKASYIDGPRTTIVNSDLFTSGGGVTQSDRIGVDDQYLYYELTVSNGGTDIIQPFSDPVKMIKESPSHSVFTISGGSSTGSVLTINATIANDWYRSAELSTSYIRWYRGTSIGDTYGGNFRTTSLSSAQLTNTSTTYTGQDSYTTTSTDNNKYITVKLFIDNSYTRTIGNNDVDGYQQAVDYTGQIQPALTAPTITSVTSGAEYGPVTVYFTGGSGPNYQLYWTTGLPDTIAPVAFDASSSSSPITDNTGPGPASSNPWFAYVRSVSSLSETSVGPSNLASDWSAGYQFTVTQAPITPTITMNANTNITTSGATINWSSSNQSFAYVNSTYVGNVNSYTFSGLSSSTFYYGTVTVYSSTGASASASYSFTTSTPAPVAPTITSGPFISWGSGNNYTLSASASNATNLEFRVQYSSSGSGSPSTGSETYFFGASSGGGTTGSQASNRNWARTRVRANNSNTGLSSPFTEFTGWV
jgi:hypothetical protein